MLVVCATENAEDCRRQAGLTPDVDRQSLLSFLADAWEAIAETGETSAARPAFLNQPNRRQFRVQ